MNTAKKTDLKKNPGNTKKNNIQSDNQDGISLLQELSGLTKSKEKGIVRIEVDSRRR